MHWRFGGQQSMAAARKWLPIKWNRKARKGSEFIESAGPGGPRRLNGVWLRHSWPKSILSSTTGLFFSSWNKSINFLQRNQSVRKILGRLSMHMEIQHTYVNWLLKKHPFAWGIACSCRCQGEESSHCLSKGSSMSFLKEPVFLSSTHLLLWVTCQTRTLAGRKHSKQREGQREKDTWGLILVRTRIQHRLHSVCGSK